ncbi:hypothetical protein QBC46DRAFT_388238 [Diplogelasinospora grovesii]|uniref:Uncharacterized protein n=1 Tax=Diplogelasinospora grovesii TaxID=303347 RepID=A0AAN6S3M4_9PEZI|nr:hypothetical protein QBC46DRAFT_388238 [Diplogelasinospora grovesii]
MAIMTETSPQPLDRPKGRRPFSALMKKLANLKAASTSDGGRHANAKRHAMKIASKKRNNNPYGQSTQTGTIIPAPTSHYSLSTTRSGRSSSATSLDREECVRLSTDGAPPTTGGRSMAQTISIADHETSRSITARSYGASSLAGTSRTANGGLESRRGGDSTFSSPAPSVRSLTTTLTTIQSMAANGGGNQNHHTSSHNHHQSHHLSNSQIIHFNQPFPTTSPASAIPAHLAPSGSTTGHPTTYATATANNLLTDNASILTLASSSKRRRRRSFDTDASVRALAPSSIFGGSRESLPLSILSANFDGTGIGTGPATPGLHRGASGIANERTSIYSANGILAAASERNSFYAKQAMTDAASVRSGLLGHGRADSISGSIGGLATSPLASPRETMAEHRDMGANGVEERDEEDDPQTPDEG